MAVRQVLAALIVTFVVSLPGLTQANPGTAARPAPAPADAQPSGNTGQQSARQPANEGNPLNLSEEQKGKLRPLLLEERQQLDALRGDSSLGQEQKIQKANDIRGDVAMKIRAILTPEQFQKLLALKQQDSEEPPNPHPSPPTPDHPPK